MNVIIDNGHGSDTPGKRSPVWPDGTQLFEFEFNRDIAKRVVSGLIQLGIDNHLLVPEDIDISLGERIKRVNALARIQKCFLVSIHGNAGGGTGWEVFTSKGETKSDGIANIFFVAARNALTGFNLRKDKSDGDFDKEADFAVLKHTTCPAILTENLFFDNYNDCRFMMSDWGRNIIAQFHIEAIKTVVL